MKYAAIGAAAVIVAVAGFFAARTEDVHFGLSRSVGDPFADPSAPTVGQTLSAFDMKPATPATASPPTDWTTRVTFKGCGQNATVRMHRTGRLLLFNGGTLARYTRGTPFPIDANAPPAYSRTIVPRDGRLVTWKVNGVYTFTFTTAQCTLWSPKVVVTVVD